MPEPRPPPIPGALLLRIAVAGLLACSLAIFHAMHQPWLGLRLAADDAAGLRIESVTAGSPAAAVLLAGHSSSPGPKLEEAIALALAGGNLRVLAIGSQPLQADDLIEEPDFHSDYAEMGAFFARQSALAAQLERESLTLTLQAGETRATVRIHPAAQRPLTDLPAVLWFQLACGLVGMMVSAWIWVLRRSDWGARMFALTGATFAVATTSAAIYSTRELAIDGSVFRLLSGLNHTGTLLFGVALIGMSLTFPRRLVDPRRLLLIPAVVVPWLMADLFRLAPNQDIGVRLPIVLMLAATIAGFVVQWRRSADDPRARSALRWVGLSMIVGCGLFVMTIVMTRLLGWLPPLEQGYSFGFFLLIYIGLALGLSRTRLFDLDRWAFRILLWLGGMLALLALDALLVLSLRLAPAASLGLSLLAVGLLYLPARNFLWERLIARGRPPDEALFPELLQVAFKASSSERAAAWQALLQRVFDPLELEPAQPSPAARSARGSSAGRHEPIEPEQAAILQDGLGLQLPAVASSPALLLRHARKGRRLFGAEQLRLANQLVEMMRHADAGRDAFERGVRVERQRVARDLHDDLGAHLLTGLSQPGLSETRHSIREAIAEMRSVVAGLSEERQDLGICVAELRHETALRLENAGIVLEWPLADGLDGLLVDYRICKNLGSMHRELVSNVIRHSGATQLSVSLELKDGILVSQLRDNGVGGALLAARNESGAEENGNESDGTVGTDGRTEDATENQDSIEVQRIGMRRACHGLRNLQRRIDELHGRIDVSNACPGTRVKIELPLGEALAITQRRPPR